VAKISHRNNSRSVTAISKFFLFIIHNFLYSLRKSTNKKVHHIWLQKILKISNEAWNDPYSFEKKASIASLNTLTSGRKKAAIG